VKNSKLFPLILPFCVTLLVPAALVLLFGVHWFFLPVQIPLGIIVAGGGLFMLAWTITLFLGISVPGDQRNLLQTKGGA
jgi:hypothetical protein